MTPDEQVSEMERAAVDAGKIIEAGWMGFKIAAVPPSAGERQVNDMRDMFFAGAQHVWVSVLRMVSAGEDITADDERRMANIQRELDAFFTDFAQRHHLQRRFGIKP